MNTTVRALNISRIIDLDARVMATVYAVSKEQPTHQGATQVKIGREKYWVGFSLFTRGNELAVRNRQDSLKYAGLIAEEIVAALKQRGRTQDVQALRTAMHGQDGFEDRTYNLLTTGQRRMRLFSRISQALAVMAIGFAAAFSQVVKAEDSIHVQVDPSQFETFYCKNGMCVNEDTNEIFFQDVKDGYYQVAPVVSDLEESQAHPSPKKSS